MGPGSEDRYGRKGGQGRHNDNGRDESACGECSFAES